MGYTYPYGQPQGIAYLYTNRLREILIAEIVAINGYEDHIANSDMEDINEAWKSIVGSIFIASPQSTEFPVYAQMYGIRAPVYDHPVYYF
jgi:hypothetical protein